LMYSLNLSSATALFFIPSVSSSPAGDDASATSNAASSIPSGTSGHPASWKLCATHALLGSFHTSECRGGVERRQLALKGVAGGD
jgi:hypothetical protein